MTVTKCSIKKAHVSFGICLPCSVGKTGKGRYKMTSLGAQLSAEWELSMSYAQIRRPNCTLPSGCGTTLGPLKGLSQRSARTTARLRRITYIGNKRVDAVRTTFKKYTTRRKRLSERTRARAITYGKYCGVNPTGAFVLGSCHAYRVVAGTFRTVIATPWAHAFRRPDAVAIANRTNGPSLIAADNGGGKRKNVRRDTRTRATAQKPRRTTDRGKRLRRSAEQHRWLNRRVLFVPASGCYAQALVPPSTAEHNADRLLSDRLQRLALCENHEPRHGGRNRNNAHERETDSRGVRTEPRTTSRAAPRRWTGLRSCAQCDHGRYR